MGSVSGNMVDSPMEKGYIFYGPSLTPPPNSALNEVSNLGLSPNRNQSLEMVPKSPNFEKRPEWETRRLSDMRIETKPNIS